MLLVLPLAVATIAMAARSSGSRWRCTLRFREWSHFRLDRGWERCPVLGNVTAAAPMGR